MIIMTQLDPRLETFFAIQNLRVSGGEETPQFEGILVIKGREVAVVKNAGRGGCNIYQWKAPFSRVWAGDKLFPLATKIASAKDPEFKSLYERDGSTALDSLVFDYVENHRVTRRGRTSTPAAPTRQPLINVPTFDEAWLALHGTPYVPTPTRAAPIAAAIANGIGVNKKVYFGREHGESTLGIVVKLNAKSAKVKTLEARGRHPAGTIFRVGPSLLTLA